MALELDRPQSWVARIESGGSARIHIAQIAQWAEACDRMLEVDIVSDGRLVWRFTDDKSTADHRLRYLIAEFIKDVAEVEVTTGTKLSGSRRVRRELVTRSVGLLSVVEDRWLRSIGSQLDMWDALTRDPQNEAIGNDLET